MKLKACNFLQCCICVALTLTLLIGLPVTASAEEEEKPLLTIGCLSDLHNQERLITEDSPTLRGTIVTTLETMQRDESIDVLLIGGDVTSDSYTTRTKVLSILDQIKSYTDPITSNVLWVTGNHDYNAGEGSERYNSAPYYSHIMQPSVGTLSDEDAYYERYRDEAYLLAYHYEIKGFDFVCLNTSPEDMAGSGQNSNYQYTDGTFSWLSDKLAEIGSEKTVFLMAHFPIAGSNSLNSSKGMVTAASQKMLNICSQYPNLVYLYGHDHSGDSAYTAEDTAQRVTVFDTEGNVAGGGVYTEPVDTELSDALVWKFVAQDGGYTLQNLATGKYLGVKGNLNTVKEPVVWKLEGTAGSYTLGIEGGESIHYSTNTETYSYGTASTLALYEKSVRDGKTVYTHASSVQNGHEYVLVADTNRALTNKISPKNSMRMAAMEVLVVSGDANMIEPPEKSVWTVDVQDAGLRFVSEDGKYLGYDENLNIKPEAEYAQINRTLWSLLAGEARQTIRLKNLGKEGLEWLHYGSSGWSLGNATDTILYRLNAERGLWLPMKTTDELADGDAVFFQDAGSSLVLSAVSNNTGGTSHRLLPSSPIQSNTMIESLPKEESDPKEDLPEVSYSFTSAFMGSMRYYNNSIDGFVGPSNSKVVQALMIYVYSDRIVLQMKNYGTESGGEWELAPYTISRNVEVAGLPGDMDADGNRTVSDVILLRQAILAGLYDKIGDMDQDGVLTVSDVVLLRQTILAGTPE